MDCCSPVADVHAATLTLWAALGVGLTTSVGHCLGMCGPLISTFSLAQGKADGLSFYREDFQVSGVPRSPVSERMMRDFA